MTSEPKVIVAKTIDIIIPVYRGIDETRACIESVMATCNANIISPHEIVVVNDASPETDIATYLVKLADEKKITLLVNPQNQGFVRSCNRALTLHADRDVVLLNSDTVVANDWLGRLRMCAYSAENIASVTPFSNNATLCSYPRPFVDNPIAPTQTESLDALFAQANAGLSVEIPTAVGFCMFMRRDAIVAVGLFDEAAFGRGYGEENDWCCRAEKLGWVHKLAADVFVWHRGGVSFGSDAAKQQAAASLVIAQRYPDYDKAVQEFRRRDPSRSVRRAVDLQRLCNSSKPRVLFINHRLPGDVERHVRDLVSIVANDLEVLILRPNAPQGVTLQWGREGEDFAAHFCTETDWNFLMGMLQQLGIQRVHIHHVHEHSIRIIDIASCLGVPLDITLHDYFPVTSSYQTAPGGTFGLQDGSVHPWGLSDDVWRKRFAVLLKSAARVIAPSHDLADRIHSHFENIRIEVHPHFEIALVPPAKFVKILVLGDMNADNGLDVVVACAREAQIHHLPLCFKIMGYTERLVDQYPDIPLFIHGSCDAHELLQLIEMERADAFLFPAQIPESFSYLLSLAKASALPIVASRLGAFAERLTDYVHSDLLAWDSSAAEWNSALMRLTSSVHATYFPQHLVETQSRALYLDWYLQKFHAHMVLPIKEFVPLGESHFYDQREATAPERSLHTLFELAVKSRHLPATLLLEQSIIGVDMEREESRRDIAILRAMVEQGKREFLSLSEEFSRTKIQMNHQIQRLEYTRDETEAAYTAIASSTSWRLTRPLRIIIAAARRLGSSVKSVLTHIR
jgi:GT2 family glycosyltransferase/glycosyltransferase involved in cell wall biosynthesis